MGIGSVPASAWRLLATVIFVVILCCHLCGLDPDKPVDRYLVDLWETAEGFPSNTVRSIAQTPDGFLWFGTDRGLIRYDGVEFFTPDFGKKQVISGHEITSLLVDSQGNLWIGSEKRLMRRSTKGEFKVFTDSSGITGDGVRCIKEDMNGNIWVGYITEFVDRFSNGKFTAFNESAGLKGKKVNSILEDRQGNLLILTRENGIFKYKNEKFSEYYVPDQKKDPDFTTLYEDRGGELWIGSMAGLLRVNRVTGEGNDIYTSYTKVNGISGGNIWRIMEDSDGNFWVATDKGLNRIKKKPDGSVEGETLLEALDVFCLFEDREGSLWVGTNGSGIRRLKDAKFQSYAPLEAYRTENPSSLYQDRHGDTWIGTSNGELYRCRGGDIIEPVKSRELSDIGIVAIAEDAEGNIWLGTNGKGVFKRENNGFSRITTQEGLADNVVTSIFRDSRGDLWFSTFDGVSVRRARDGGIQSYTSPDDLPGKKVRGVYESETGDIWVATDKGIAIFSKAYAVGRDFSRQEESASGIILEGTSITCIYEDHYSQDAQGKVYWIATEGAGLIRFVLTADTEFSHTYTSYTKEHGMTDNFIYQFFEDSWGNFWSMSNSGILRVPKKELNDLAAGITGSINCFSYGTSDGLRSFEFDNKLSPNSVLENRDGQFWFITKKGISIVNPERLRIRKLPPPGVIIHKLSFDRGRDSLQLPPETEPLTFKGATSIRFHFTAATFLSAEKARFRYKLEGVDEDWRALSPGEERAAHYSDLSSGSYIFRVTACNAEGVWNNHGDSVTVTLKAFFLRTIFFKIIVLLVFIAFSALSLYMYRKKQQLIDKKEKYKGTRLEPDFVEECTTRLKYLMEIDKVYSDADISLHSLAEKMSIAPHLLSQLLNENLNRSFTDLINGYRIEEVKKILQTSRGAQRKIASIAIEVGFNTMVAFYNAFKKYAGMTPTQYKKEILDEKQE